MNDMEKNREGINRALSQITDTANKFLQFELAGEHYGVDILSVREINAMMDITRVPRTPIFMRGLINLRGKVIPIIDLRLKFGIEEKAYDERSTIIVIEIIAAHNIIQMGIVVDMVSEVITVNSNQIEPPPNFGTTLKDDYILGMAKLKDTVVILLDIDLILTDEELTFSA